MISGNWRFLAPINDQQRSSAVTHSSINQNITLYKYCVGNPSLFLFKKKQNSKQYGITLIKKKVYIAHFPAIINIQIIFLGPKLTTYFNCCECDLKAHTLKFWLTSFYQRWYSRYHSSCKLLFCFLINVWFWSLCEIFDHVNKLVNVQRPVTILIHVPHYLMRIKRGELHVDTFF